MGLLPMDVSPYPFTWVYAGVVGVNHRFDDDSYARLYQTGISWQTVQEVLRAHPQIAHHIGATLRVAAPIRDWVTGGETWIVVALIEEDDDNYLVVSARQLTAPEVEAARKMLEGGT